MGRLEAELPSLVPHLLLCLDTAVKYSQSKAEMLSEEVGKMLWSTVNSWC